MEAVWSILKRWFSSSPTKLPPAVADAEWRVEEEEDCRIYRGRFVIYDQAGRAVRRIRGRVIEWPGLPTDVYLRDPPAELRHHTHGPCLQLVSEHGPWFKLHFQRPARDFTDSRDYVEQLLVEAFLRTQTR
jgi:hypothetical protein